MREEVKSRKPTPKKKYSSDHGHREQGVLNDLIDYCPRFLDVPNDDWVSVSKGQDPPDLVGSGRIGLELTEWLNPNQTTEAMRRLRMRGDLLRLLNEQSLPAPQNYRLVFVRPRWVKISGKEIESLRLQFHTMCQQKDLCWHSDPSVQLGWAWVIEQSFAAYPMLQKYIASVRFKADGANIAQHGFSWIRSEPEGGTQNPSDAIKALRELIIQKCRKYRNNRHLAEKHLGELVLLVHSGPMRAILNSPYDLNFPDLLENLRYVVGQISDLSFECSLFKSIWLFQRPLGQEEHGRNRWLAQIYPTLTMPTWYSARVVNMTERASLPRQADSTSTRQAGGYVRLGRC